MGASQTRDKIPEEGSVNAVAPEKENVTSTSDDDEEGYAGLKAIRKVCNELYSGESHLTVAAVLKSWLGGPDPLDYISIYCNNGDPDNDIPAHWFYVTCGLSDLHGDNRVHAFSGPGQQSGYGFELTLRLKKADNEDIPPMWPTGLLNCLARYVFQTDSILHVGDHVPWGRSLDGRDDSQSRIQHILITKDPQLAEITGPYGNLDFRQLVGVTEEEMKAAQKWKGTGVLELMKTIKEIGPYFLTDIERSKSIFEIDKALMGCVNDGINSDGSDFGYVTSLFKWTEINGSHEDLNDSSETKQLESVHVMFDREAADILPLVARGRLQKGRLFVYENAVNQVIHFVPPECHLEGITVNSDEPLKAAGGALQIYCNDSFITKMIEEFDCLTDCSEEDKQQPLEFQFSDPTVIISVFPAGQLEKMPQPEG